MTKLQEYNFELMHKLENTQKKAHALSQRLDHMQGKDNNKDQILLKKEIFRQLIVEGEEFWKEMEEMEEFMEKEVRGALEQQEEGWKHEGKMLQQNKLSTGEKRERQKDLIKM